MSFFEIVVSGYSVHATMTFPFYKSGVVAVHKLHIVY